MFPHILVVTSAYPTTPDGNHATFLRETILRLQARGMNFTVFAPAYEGQPSHWLDGVRVHRFRYCLKPWENLARDGAPTKLQRQPWYKAIAALYILLGSAQLTWVCWRDRPDALHIHWPFPHALMAWPAHKLFSIPMVLSCHGAELLLSRKFGFVAPLLRWLLPQANGVTVNSSFTQGLLRTISAVPATTIPYGLTIEPKPVPGRSPTQPPQVLFVGRLDERKGLVYLLRAMVQVLEKFPTARLRVVGRGHLEADLHAQCAELGLVSQVDFLGFVSKDELAQEYATCDVFVLPAIVDSKGDTEGLGIVMIEALAHGKPVVASDVGGISDVIRASQTGLLVPEKDPPALAQAIVRLLNDSDLGHALGQAGLRDIQARFGWEQIAPQWEQVLANALADSTSAPQPLEVA